MHAACTEAASWCIRLPQYIPLGCRRLTFCDGASQSRSRLLRCGGSLGPSLRPRCALLLLSPPLAHQRSPLLIIAGHAVQPGLLVIS